MFKDFAFKRFELYEVWLAASRAVFVVFGFFRRKHRLDKPCPGDGVLFFLFFPFRNVRFGVSFAVWGTGLYKRNVSSSEESLFLLIRSRKAPGSSGKTHILHLKPPSTCSDPQTAVIETNDLSPPPFGLVFVTSVGLLKGRGISVA